MLALLAVGSGFSPPLSAQEAEVADLSADSFSNRQRATLQMWRVREQSRDEVQRAARHQDPEVAGRAQWILRQWRRGSLPGTPPEISRLLAKNPGVSGIESLLVEGQFAAAQVALEESAGTLEYETMLQRIQLTLTRRFPSCVHAAIELDRLPQLLEFVDTVALTAEMAVCRAQLIRELGLEIDQLGVLPKSSSTWSAADQTQAAVMVLLSLGRTDQAIEAAHAGTDKHLLHQTRAIAGHWQDAMVAVLAEARAAESGSVEAAQLWSTVMACADRANDQQVFAEALDKLTSADLIASPSARELCWKTLVSHGQVDQAIELLDAFDPESAALMSIESSRIQHAFEVLEFPLDQIDSNIHLWVGQAIDRQRQDPSGEPVPSFNRLLTLIRCLIAIGREDVARTAITKLCNSDVPIGSLQLRDYVLFSLLQTRRSDWVVEFAVREGELALSPQIREIVSRSLADADSTSLELVIEFLASINREQNLADRLAAACELINGQIPDGFDPARDFRKLYDFATELRRPVRGRPPVPDGQIRANMSVVRIFLTHGQTEFASGLLRKLVAAGEHAALLQLAEQELDAGSNSVAETLFQALYESVSGPGSLSRSGATMLFGDAVGDVVSVQALIGLWTIARRNGDHSRAAELESEVRFSLCSPSTRLRLAIAEYLADRNEQSLATEVFDYLLPMSMFENQERTGIYDVARGYSLMIRDTNVAAAARWYDLAICDMVRDSNFRAGAYVTLPLYVQRWAVEAAVQRQDTAAIGRHIDRILQLDPLDISLAENVLPQLRERGLGSFAEQTMARIMQAGVRHVEQFPRDAMTANNLAWVAAINGTELETALQLAQQAVFREPESAIYRDTLAEILFRLDRREEALLVEQACLLDDPTQWHLHQQVDKYRDALHSR
jgi:tetratricopeptide (TPR) repeat protein